jgi:hypothetical protein
VLIPAGDGVDPEPAPPVRHCVRGIERATFILTWPTPAQARAVELLMIPQPVRSWIIRPID